MSMYLYYFLRFLTRKGMIFFFKRMEIHGTEKIPQKSPFILVANHQNAFLDAMIAATLIDQPLTFLTRSDVFKAPFSYFLSWLNMWPVYRRRDGYENLSKNEEIFNNCKSLLQSGKPLLVFPEGNMALGYHLRPLSKGTARLAMQAQEIMSEALYILPVGINYFDHHSPRKRLMINIGDPINVQTYWSEYEQHQAKAIVRLRNDMTDALKSLMILPDIEEYHQVRKDYLLRSSEYLTFEQLRDKLNRMDGSSQMVTQTEKSNDLLKFLLTLPNWPVIILLRYVLIQLKDPQFILSIKFLFSILVLPLYWFLAFILAWTFGSLWMATVILMTMIATLFFRQEI